METNSIGIRKWAGTMAISKAWESGVGDGRMIGWQRGDGAQAIETNGDPVFEDAPEFADVWVDHE